MVRGTLGVSEEEHDDALKNRALGCNEYDCMSQAYTRSDKCAEYEGKEQLGGAVRSTGVRLDSRLHLRMMVAR